MRENSAIDIDIEGVALEIEIDDMFVVPTIIGLLYALEIFMPMVNANCRCTNKV